MGLYHTFNAMFATSALLLSVASFVRLGRALPPSVPLWRDEVCWCRCGLRDHISDDSLSLQGFWFGNFTVGPQTFSVWSILCACVELHSQIYLLCSCRSTPGASRSSSSKGSTSPVPRRSRRTSASTSSSTARARTAPFPQRCADCAQRPSNSQ